MNSLRQVCSLIFGNDNADWVELRNKLFYVLAMSYILVSAFIAGHSPCTYPRFSAIGTSVLLFFRIFQYTHKNWYLYFFDFCYYVNVLFIVAFLYGADDSLMHTVFSFSILVLSGVTTYGNSLVPHSLEMFTTCYIHVNPAVAIALMKLNKCYHYKCELTHIVKSLIWYNLLHIFFYYLIIIIVLRCFWEKYKTPNLFYYWLNSPNIGPLINSVPKYSQGLIYMAMVMTNNIFLVFVSYLLCESDLIFVLVIITNLIYVLYRGANYYLIYLPRRYNKENKGS